MRQTEVLTPEAKAAIDAMSQFEMARLWRFARIGEFPYIGEAGAYFEQQFKAKGGFTPEISKRLGWDG
jgi:hypothetical protein